MRRNRAARKPELRCVVFKFQHSLARRVCIAGTFNGWNPDATLMVTAGHGQWVLELNKKFPKPVPSESDYRPMSCPKCKDEVVKTKDWTARGANKPDGTIVRHLCAGCADTITTTGHGKAKQNVVTHKCTSCGAEDSVCCNTKKGSDVATKGMEKAKSINVAPLK